MDAGQDVDQDGQVDLLLGAPYSDTNVGDSGAVYLMSGPISGEISVSTASRTLVGGEVGEQAGSAIGLADLNGDGQLDYLVGAPLNSSGNYAGLLYVLNGPIDPFVLLSTADGKWAGDWANGRFGAALDASSDLDGDGLVDVVVGAPERDAGHGAAYVLTAPLDVVGSVQDAWATFHGDNLGARFGATLASQDVNQDGFADLLIGAPEHDPYNILAGAGFLTLGNIEEGTHIPSAVFHGEEDFALLGSAVAPGSQGFWLGAPGQDFASGALFLLSGL